MRGTFLTQCCSVEHNYLNLLAMADYMILKVRITLRARTFYSTHRIEHFSKYEEDWLKYPDITVEKNGSRFISSERHRSLSVHWVSTWSTVTFCLRLHERSRLSSLWTVAGYKACQCNTSAKALCMHYSTLNVDSGWPFCPRRPDFGGREKKNLLSPETTAWTLKSGQWMQ